MKIEIKCRFSGKVLFEHEQENNTTKITLDAGIKARSDLRFANLSYADLSFADLSFAELRSADLSYADLRSADLSSANLSYAELSSANLSFADLSYADLRYANLHSANLSYADLRYANLHSATYGEGVEIGHNPLFIMGLTWPVYIFKSHIKIGCQIHSKKEWLAFADSDIAKMESHAAEFWKKWKKHILWMAFEGE